ncbi:hypothetical protein QQP08_013937 [Theobroma cacao]|nr:hypothetical protein QQP08_013937 [Theobroma cacao]
MVMAKDLVAEVGAKDDMVNKGNPANKSCSKVPFSVTIARSMTTKKLNARPSKGMRTNKQTFDCSNHMTGSQLLFKELNETQKSNIRFGDDKHLQVEGKGQCLSCNSFGNLESQCSEYEQWAKWRDDLGSTWLWEEPSTPTTMFSLSCGREVKRVLKSLVD